MIDRANASDPHPVAISPRAESAPSARPWSVPDRPVARPLAREGQPPVTSATAHVHEGMQALPWPSTDGRASRTARHSAPELRERLLGLREAVASHVRQRRDEGVPVERTLAEVKALVRRAEGCDLSREATDALMPQVVRWGIQAYYDQDAESVDAWCRS